VTVIVRVQKPLFPALRQRSHLPAMRRSFVYPHRSIRSIRAGTGKLVLAALTVIALTAAIAVFQQPLLLVHNQLCLALLQLSGIPITGVAPVELFAPFGAAPVPVVAVQEISNHPVALWTLFSVAMLVFLELHRRIPFARSFLVFLMTLLAMAAGILIFHPASQFGSTEFAAMWLRSELLVWLVLPWFSASMFVLIEPTPLFGVGWAILTQIYGIAWSAIRLAFCIAAMHYSGILFAPIFWFAFGFLADVIYLVVFYSVALQWAARHSWGKRTQ
jgi:hypothetical protein